MVEGREKRKTLVYAQFICHFLSQMVLIYLVGPLVVEPGGMEE